MTFALTMARFREAESISSYVMWLYSATNRAISSIFDRSGASQCIVACPARASGDACRDPRDVQPVKIAMISGAIG
jgi:hypothetical protein